MFDVMAAIAKITTAAGSAKKLLDASKTLANADLKQMIAELAMQLADASLEMAELKHEVLRLQQENSEMKTKRETAKPRVVNGCYVFDGDENLYCPACYDTKGKKYLTSGSIADFRMCTVCKAHLRS